MKKRIIGFLLCIAMTASVLIAAVPAIGAKGEALPFKDVPENEWYEPYVRFVWEREIMNGTSSTTFGPDESMTRGQIVTILSRMSGDTVTGMASEMNFEDVDKNEYYADPIGWAVKNEIAKGMSATAFEPETPVLRQEFAAFFVRYMKYKGITLESEEEVEPFPDKALFPDWAVSDIETLQKTGLVKGDAQGSFNPGDKMTRAEIATVTKRFVELCEKDAVDPMFKAIEDFIDEYTCVTHQDVIHMTVYSGSQYETALRTVPLDAMGLDPEVYEMCFDEDELEDAKSDVSGQGNGYGAGGEIEFWVRNKDTNEETEHFICNFSARKNLYSDLNALLICPDESVLDNETEVKLKAFDCTDESHEKVAWLDLRGIHILFPDAASFTEDSVKALILSAAGLDDSYDVILRDFDPDIAACGRFQANIIRWNGKVADITVALFFIPSVDPTAPAGGTIGTHPAP